MCGSIVLYGIYECMLPCTYVFLSSESLYFTGGSSMHRMIMTECKFLGNMNMIFIGDLAKVILPARPEGTPLQSRSPYIHHLPLTANGALLPLPREVSGLSSVSLSSLCPILSQHPPPGKKQQCPPHRRRGR